MFPTLSFNQLQNELSLKAIAWDFKKRMFVSPSSLEFEWSTDGLEAADCLKGCTKDELDMAVEAMKLARYDVRINTHASLMRPILEEALKRLEENNVQR